MITKDIITTIYEAASIQRWNDHIRPWVGFTELDKQGHKMFYAYVLAKCENNDVDFLKLIEGGIFEFFHRIILTDIKPPVFHRLVKEKGDELNKWVLEQLRDVLSPIGGGFYERMTEYYTNPKYSYLEKEILRAAHYQASYFEFNVIYPLNQATYDIEKVKSSMINGLAACDTFSGFKYFMGSPYLKKFMLLLGKLRYQQRWSKAARVPNTFVMGHMLVVAILSYFSAIEANACRQRCINDFYGGLFHDIPEALTRDIVSPIKRSIEGLNNIISGIEAEEMEKSVYTLLPKKWHSYFKYLLNDEFSSKVIVDDNILKVSSDDINLKYNEDKFSPVDGEIIRCCDHLSAYLEAYLSLEFGIRSKTMADAYTHFKEEYSGRVVSGVDFGKIFNEFYIKDID